MNKSNSGLLSYLWLAIGLVLLVFSNGIQTIIPITTWLAPVFLIRFMSTQSKLKGSLIFLPLYLIAWIYMVFGLYSGIPEWVSVLTGVIYGLVFFLPFLADRLLTPKIKGFLATLVFPTAFVSLEYLLSLTPANTWFSLAYTQSGTLPLIQLVSVAGIWGVSFLIAWFASVVNWIWENEFSLSKTWKGAALYLGILVAVLLFGTAYLTFLPADAEKVQAAGITRSFDMDVEAKKCKGDVICLKELFNRSLDEFLDDSKQAADSGAQIIMWQENALAAYQEDEEVYIERGREFAVDKDVYLVMGMYTLSEDRTKDENKAFLISPAGQVSEYKKNYLTPGDNHILGDGRVLIQDSTYGKLGTIICQDTHTLNLVRQAGQADVDLMLIPNHNWESITPYVATMPIFRAIENGFSMMRADYHGLSNAVDFHGNVLAELNDFTSEERIMYADIPTQGVTTVYSRLGDFFAWLCMLGFVGLTVLAIRNRKQG